MLASVVPQKYKDNDPRSLLYQFPSMNKFKYAKLMQKFSFYKSVEVAESVANSMGYSLIPACCLHWKRKQALTDDEMKVKVGRNSFFLMKPGDLSKREKEKLQQYLAEVESEGA